VRDCAAAGCRTFALDRWASLPSAPRAFRRAWRPACRGRHLTPRELEHWPRSSSRSPGRSAAAAPSRRSDPLQVADDCRHGREQAVAADPGDGRLEGFHGTIQLGDLAAPLALGAGLERRQAGADLVQGGLDPGLAGLGRVELVELGHRGLQGGRVGTGRGRRGRGPARAVVVAGAAPLVLSPEPRRRRRRDRPWRGGAGA
jgi:hypothetical protein